MKARLSILLVLAVSIVLLGTGWTHAAVTNVRVLAGDTVVMSLGNAYWLDSESGGEFGMTVAGNPPDSNQNGTFYTFCADPNTFMYLGVTYTVKAVSSQNWLGYQLSDYGKWIYYEYSQDSSIASVPGHTALTNANDPYNTLAGAIQEGIWTQLWKTDPTTGQLVKDSNGNPIPVALPGDWANLAAYDQYEATWEAAYAAWLAAGHTSADLGSVGIAQLVLDDGDVQNQMVLTVVQVGPSFSTVPEPATIIIWSLLGAGSWLGMRVWRRRGPGLGDDLSGPARQPWSPEARQAIHEIIGRGSREQS